LTGPRGYKRRGESNQKIHIMSRSKSTMTKKETKKKGTTRFSGEREKKHTTEKGAWGANKGEGVTNL
jgi:hypothetical protein